MKGKHKSPKEVADKSARFIEAAKKAGAGESEKLFEKAFKRIVKADKKTLDA